MTRSDPAGATTAERVFACTVDALEPGTSMTLHRAEPIAVHRTEDGEFHATADTCSHEKWSLGEDADLEGNEVICPLHMARFDVRTGAALCLPATIALRTYPLEIEGDSVYVLL
ncbi:non-heme iron oxygenase ferredoxin subunit [Pseudonocardia sp. CA-107938]|uniref:non-heme iron oxygenase ferredoxin subunit n=1 Tax=Pseudonocardia sp. CA-107938 TaxID=3240021 RepID=UPI003D94B03F